NSVIYAQGSDIQIALDDQKLCISDGGKGVPKESLDKLFERFYRVESSRNRSHGGLGLGLAIVQEIIQAHGWSIRAQSNKPQGLMLTIDLAGGAKQAGTDHAEHESKQSQDAAK